MGMLFYQIRVVIVEFQDLAGVLTIQKPWSEANYSEHMILQEEHFIQ